MLWGSQDSHKERSRGERWGCSSNSPHLAAIPAQDYTCAWRSYFAHTSPTRCTVKKRGTLTTSVWRPQTCVPSQAFKTISSHSNCHCWGPHDHEQKLASPAWISNPQNCEHEKIVFILCNLVLRQFVSNNRTAEQFQIWKLTLLSFFSQIQVYTTFYLIIFFLCLIFFYFVNVTLYRVDRLDLLSMSISMSAYFIYLSSLSFYLFSLGKFLFLVSNFEVWLFAMSNWLLTAVFRLLV